MHRYILYSTGVPVMRLQTDTRGCEARRDPQLINEGHTSLYKWSGQGDGSDAKLWTREGKGTHKRCTRSYVFPRGLVCEKYNR